MPCNKQDNRQLCPPWIASRIKEPQIRHKNNFRWQTSTLWKSKRWPKRKGSSLKETWRTNLLSWISSTKKKKLILLMSSVMSLISRQVATHQTWLIKWSKLRSKLKRRLKTSPKSASKSVIATSRKERMQLYQPGWHVTMLTKGRALCSTWSYLKASSSK